MYKVIVKTASGTSFFKSANSKDIKISQICYGFICKHKEHTFLANFITGLMVL